MSVIIACTALVIAFAWLVVAVLALAAALRWKRAAEMVRRKLDGRDLRIRQLVVTYNTERDRSQRDAGELHWWRSQFSTRFYPGALPKPGTALTGRRYALVEVPPRNTSAQS